MGKGWREAAAAARARAWWSEALLSSRAHTPSPSSPLGYYGRPFEARNKARGGAFVGADKDFLRFSLGDGSVVKGFEEAVTGMRPGGVRRVIVPVELGYPDGDFNRVGPKPTTFSGRRALSFVLKNQGMIDKTLMFDVELLRLNKVGRKGV